MFRKLTDSLMSQNELRNRAELYRRLLRHEARLGGTVFGEIPADRRREFFCLDEHTWVWHEQWPDKQGVPRYVTTRYDIRPGGIVKHQNGQYLTISAEEATNLLRAARTYRQRVYDKLYRPVFEAAGPK